MHRLPPLSVLFSLLLLSACAAAPGPRDGTGTQIPPDGDGDIAITEQLPAGTFGRGENGFSGSFFVRGFAVTEERREPFCERNCETFEYVLFRVLETGNADLPDYLRQLAGNAYVAGDALGLGCRTEDGALRYFNASDARGMREETLGAGNARRILEATADAPVTLFLEKLPFSGGSEAPACYSHFTTIRVRSS